MSTDESIFQKILQFLLEKEDHIIMIGTRLPDIAISARGLTNTHRKQLKTDAGFIYNHCLLPMLELLEEKNHEQ